MSRTPVQSTSIRSLGYDATRRVLEVEFRRGAVYEYAGVPPRVFEALLTAESVGQTFMELVRDRYDYERVYDDVRT